MTKPWFNSIVEFRWMDGGTWKVVGRENTWCELAPQNSMARVLASLSPYDTVWIRTRDLTRTEPTGDTLL